MDKKTLMLVGAIVLIVLAAVLIFRQATRPPETIGDYHKVPPKGAGKADAGRTGAD